MGARSLGKAIAESLDVGERLTVSEWADRYRVLSPKGAAEPGRWRTSRTPYLREIMDCFAPDSPVQDVWFMKGAQVGATELGINCVGYTIDVAPGPMLFVEPTLEMAKKAVKQRLDPLIDETPRLRALLPAKRSKDGGNALFEKQFPSGILMMAGANSAASLRSMPIRYLLLDEVDAYPGDVEDEGDPVQLAAARTRTFQRRKHLYISTPTIAGVSRIERGYQSTDQRRYFVPCPHCGTYQTIDWKRIRWDPEDLSRHPWLECEANACVIEERSKRTMLAAGEWRATAPENSKRTVRGYHLSSLYSPYGWLSWADARDKYLAGLKDVTQLKTFVMTILGETWVERGDAPPWARLHGRRETYERGTIPMGGTLFVAGADVQKDRIEVELRAWGPRYESWSIDYLVLEGDTAKVDAPESPWRKLEELLARRWPHASGAEIPIALLAVDSGYATQTVYSWVRRQDHRRVVAIKGSSTAATLIGQATPVEVMQSGKKIRRGLRLWPVGVSIAKGELYGWLRQDPSGDAEAPPTGWTHFPDYGDEYFKQLCAEQLVTRQSKRGYVRYEWEKLRERNEALDCAVYVRAAAAIKQMDRFQPGDWKRLAKALGIRSDAAQPERPPPAVIETPAAASVAAELVAALSPPPAPPPAHAPAKPAPKPKPKAPPRRGGFWGRRGR
jgi:phage terminase large subunit GpA-like protein